MRTMKHLALGICAVAAVMAFSNATPARGQEPHYLQALSDLRTARDYFQYDTGKFRDERHHVVDEINHAIEEIKHAVWDDGKNTKFAGPGPGATNGWAPMHYGDNWLVTARSHVIKGVDTPENAGLRDRAIMHIDEAIKTANLILRMGGQ